MSKRKSDYPIAPLILNRWSPRSMTGEALSEDELFPLFDAARWAPSSYNNQPWRFIYAYRDTPEWDTFFSLLKTGNQEWCKKAGALIVIVSHKIFERNGKPSRTHSFDTGMACQNLGLEAFNQGLACHFMSGFSYDEANEVLKVPKDYTVEAMLAVGKQAPAEELAENLREIEKPSTRKPLGKILMNGSFKA
ncbi:MAG: hypothetical protein SP1CHLAM54_08500 [Chlamydiia bacterium]|nr:hypothetical protein [Chlamydiia bacterium]MCH9615756.1 hypothetical protein [Chlamydiia bacterium]MCH9628841.1 hypothetical protein [Chlamydiia bacterium]